MALTSILAPIGNRAIFTFNRGNIGILDDIVALGNGMITLPSLGAVCDYPSINNVRLGITYGWGTGNIVLPDSTDVKTGIQYGSLGTENTGSFVWGGGFISIINE